MATASEFPALPTPAPSLFLEEPVIDSNGFAYADDVLSIVTTRRFADGAPMLYLEAYAERARPEGGDEGMEAEGYADVSLTLDRARALRDALPALVAYLEALPTDAAAR